MATYLPQAVRWTIYYNGNHSGSSSPGTSIKSITDGDSANQEFTATDSITMRTNSDADLAGWKYLGTTTTIDGGPHLVFELKVGQNTFVYVIGTGPTDTVGDIDPGEKVAPATVADLNIDSSSFTVCFFPGTMIASPSGERKVEELAAGDSVVIGYSSTILSNWFSRNWEKFRLRFGFARTVPVKWIGRQTVSTLFGPAERLMPVRISAGSLGGMPHSDLTVTADHAILVDGVLCEAAALVNGTSITRVPLTEFGESYTVYHIETEAHEVILANGTPTETFIDNISRRAFDNFAEFERLHGDKTEMKELPYPRASNARHLPARIKARLGLDLRARRPRRSAS